MPHIAKFRAAGASARIVPAFPAVTCTAQANYLTGASPTRHGVVGNGWYDRQLSETHFWKQSNHLVAGAKILGPNAEARPQIHLRKIVLGGTTCIPPRRLIRSPRAPPIPRRRTKGLRHLYGSPQEFRPGDQKNLGRISHSPHCWGPAAGINGSLKAEPTRHRAGSADSRQPIWTEKNIHLPTYELLIYLPRHLDYNLQQTLPRFAFDRKFDLSQIDNIVKRSDFLFFQNRGVKVVLLSEYGIVPAQRPIHLNRVFREQGWIAIREELGLELLDCGASKVFAVADHQVAHIYVNDLTLLPRSSMNCS